MGYEQNCSDRSKSCIGWIVLLKLLPLRIIKVVNVLWDWKRLALLVVCVFCIIQLLRSPRENLNQGEDPAISNKREGKRVLVTGVAGFIGYHVAKALIEIPDTTVIGIDNFNDYYDVRLKIDRGFDLQSLGITVYREDLCTQALLFTVFLQHNFTHVVHLAAQAGVRYSLKNPLSYIHSNVECQLALLDVLLEYPHTKLVYASSSSVYGKGSPVPFRLSASTDHPGNMYAASKKTDELLTLHYCRAHGLTAVGLRFFTVYGPWGRPDMAVYKFAEAILNRKELPLFQEGEDAPLERDFTYIDDIVEGILSALEYRPTRCGELFNLGFGHPLSVPKMVEHLEEQLHVKANVKMLPIPPSEILKTWADISLSKAALGFNPKVNLAEGVRRFGMWYKAYRQQREEEDRISKPTAAHLWFERITEDQILRREQYERESRRRYNTRLQKRLHYESQKQGQEHHVPKNKTFKFHQGRDSIGGDLVYIPELRNNIHELILRCKELDHCLAFTSGGVLKHRLAARHKWVRRPSFTEPTQGLYVANVAVCQSNLHDCSEHARCHSPSKMPGQYSCECDALYAGDGHTCLSRYKQVLDTRRPQAFPLDHLSIFNISDIKKYKRMIFIQGMDSPGGDYLSAEEFANDLPQLQYICETDPICIGITTKGIMKRRILPRDRWIIWTDDPERGIFVYDIDYCQLNEAGCPANAKCQCIGPADFRCVCLEGYISRNRECIRSTGLG